MTATGRVAESNGAGRDPAEAGAAEVTATVIVAAPAPKVFAAFTAWERQGEWIPFTTVRIVSGDGGEGSLIEAVTAVGPAVLRDEMRVDRIDRPYEIRVIQYGQLLRGPGLMRCTPLGRARTQAARHEWVQLRGGPVRVPG